MIAVHRLRGEPMFLNADLLETIEATPDTVLTLVDGRRIVVAELNLGQYRREIERLAGDRQQVIGHLAGRGHVVLVDEHLATAAGQAVEASVVGRGFQLFEGVDVADFGEWKFKRRSTGLVFDDVANVLEAFVHGLNGRRLKIEAGEQVYTDTETLFVPATVSRFEQREQNFQLYKAMVVHQWAQTWYGTWRIDPDKVFGGHADCERAR